MLAFACPGPSPSLDATRQQFAFLKIFFFLMESADRCQVFFILFAKPDDTKFDDHEK